MQFISAMWKGATTNNTELKWGEVHALISYVLITKAVVGCSGKQKNDKLF